MPVIIHPLTHAERADHLDMAAIVLRQLGEVAARAQGRLARRAGHAVVDDGEPGQHQRTGQRRHTQPHMEQRQQRQEQHHPRQVHQGAGAGRAQEGAHRIQIAQGSDTVIAAAVAAQRQF